MYATSMKDRILAAARAKARELQEAAKPGSAAPELEEALDAAEGKPVVSRQPTLPADTVAGPPGDDAQAAS
jgi:1-acyl-sn-glycerol-3-phosphate acyltransferase